MARKRENPASGPGLKKNTNCACREDNTPIRLEAQGFSSCVPCANCPHFRLVRFNSRKKRHQCSYSGLWLESCGVIECPVRREGVDLRKILPFACQGRLCCRCEHASIRQNPFIVVFGMRWLRLIPSRFIAPNTELSGRWMHECHSPDHRGNPRSSASPRH